MNPNAIRHLWYSNELSKKGGKSLVASLDFESPHALRHADFQASKTQGGTSVADSLDLVNPQATSRQLGFQRPKQKGGTSLCAVG